MAVTWRRDGMVGFVELDSPPVNAIGQAMRQGLLDAVDRAEAEGVSRVILSGAGRGFAAGADAKEFDFPPEPPHLPDVLNRIESSAVPWIAAIHGPALGGGAEIALACRYRIARADAQIGFPEVILGVVPGAGGTQRLPRLVGMEQALDLIPSGKALSGQAARGIGLVDMVADDPQAAALALGDDVLAAAVPVGARDVTRAEAAAFDAARRTAGRKMRGQGAPLRAIDLLALAQDVPLAQGMTVERETFLSLRQGAEARALRHIFFTERGARQPKSIAASGRAVTRAAVVGGGTMGSGIAYALLNAGIAVTLLETDAAAVARAQANVDGLIATSLKRGLIDEAGAEARRARFAATTDYGAAQGVDLAIEAVFEDMGVKHAVFARLQAACGPDTVLATNTSYLDVNQIAAGLDDPSRLVGLHFFAPAHIMKLLEIVRGDASSDEALATGFGLAKTLRKIPVLAGVCDGFIGNRILARYREAADTLLIDGATPAEVDAAMTGFGYAMGPYEAQDLSGLDIAHANRRRQDATRDPNRRYVAIGDRLVAEGRLGKKTGAGWYRYDDGRKAVDPAVEALVRDESARAGVTRRAFSAEEIAHRLVLAMINEAAGILWDGIAQTASDIDLVTVHGYGFPRWRGGLMCHADQVGVAQVLDGVRALEREDPLVWRPGDLLVECAARGIALRDWTRG
ncbi:3-hydroxyacyl-CoA dehydrogenase NAD-binding domain-containing protein [Mesobacterium sp. TK19101]|uniref:3-hydroxyacyl-CoA dehydrogenase NAD-binding domain-containing protein n=1 Tax=Mesobacterium hydrothermale TaxID=3111907 RepID=A0ABU6HJH1_9RHOB|nr:3-hydroxyacyl-CoA dehydrogenase NAD-binding domain-containing protein [Mesobacterium sp. TK19101]MEC3862604.1 3-hydroxyacyl-CoA dehydrogenase NAD-binding domain-containing protein [Mesobacterium sp. TK19101]